MRVASIFFALLSAPFLVLAANGPNAFKIPTGGLSATGGQPLTLNWTPTTQGTVSLILRSGSSSDLSQGTVIASYIPNSGTYTWTPSNSITRGSDYAIEIVDDSDPTQVNYTPPFVLDTTNTVASTTPTVTEGVSTATSSGKKSHHHTKSASGVSSSSAASTGTSSGASSMVTSSGAITKGSPTGKASTSGPGASFQNTAGGASTTSGNSGARATAAAGMLGLVALGALAL